MKKIIIGSLITMVTTSCALLEPSWEGKYAEKKREANAYLAWTSESGSVVEPEDICIKKKYYYLCKGYEDFGGIIKQFSVLQPLSDERAAFYHVYVLFSPEGEALVSARTTRPCAVTWESDRKNICHWKDI